MEDIFGSPLTVMSGGAGREFLSEPRSSLPTRDVREAVFSDSVFRSSFPLRKKLRKKEAFISSVAMWLVPPGPPGKQKPTVLACESKDGLQAEKVSVEERDRRVDRVMGSEAKRLLYI